MITDDENKYLYRSDDETEEGVAQLAEPSCETFFTHQTTSSSSSSSSSSTVPSHVAQKRVPIPQQKSTNMLETTAMYLSEITASLQPIRSKEEFVTMVHGKIFAISSTLSNTFPVSKHIFVVISKTIVKLFLTMSPDVIAKNSDRMINLVQCIAEDIEKIFSTDVKWYKACKKTMKQDIDTPKVHRIKNETFEDIIGVLTSKFSIFSKSGVFDQASSVMKTNTFKLIEQAALYQDNNMHTLAVTCYGLLKYHMEGLQLVFTSHTISYIFSVLFVLLHMVYTKDGIYACSIDQVSYGFESKADFDAMVFNAYVINNFSDFLIKKLTRNADDYEIESLLETVAYKHAKENRKTMQDAISQVADYSYAERKEHGTLLNNKNEEYNREVTSVVLQLQQFKRADERGGSIDSVTQEQASRSCALQ